MHEVDCPSRYYVNKLARLLTTLFVSQRHLAQIPVLHVFISYRAYVLSVPDVISSVTRKMTLRPLGVSSSHES